MLGNAKDGSVLNLLSIFWRFHVWSIVLNSQWQIFQLCQFHVLCNHLNLSVPLAELCFTTYSLILSFFLQINSMRWSQKVSCMKYCFKFAMADFPAMSISCPLQPLKPKCSTCWVVLYNLQSYFVFFLTN